MRYAVETLFTYGWENCWQDDGKLLTFETREEAATALEEHMKACNQAFEDNHLATPPSPDEYRIVEVPQKLPNGEYACTWRCPYCQQEQTDSIHPQYGPFISTTCANCGKTSHDDQLDPASVASLELARTAAEKEAAS